MKQVILTNSCGYPHPLLQAMNKRELLQAKLDQGTTIDNLMVDLESILPSVQFQGSKHNVCYQTVEDFVNEMNNNDSTHYFTLLNLPELKKGMHQITLEIPTDSPHLTGKTYVEFKDYLQKRIDSGEKWADLFKEINEGADIYKYETLGTLTTFLNGEDVISNYFVVLNIPAEETEPKAETAEIPTFDYNLVAFQNHMHSKLSDAVEDMDDYIKVMTALWKIFNKFGWVDSDCSYLEAIDRFCKGYSPSVNLKDHLKIGAKVETIRGEVLTVKNFMFVNADDCYQPEYYVFIEFEERDKPESFTDYGWNSMASMYSPLNIVAIDGEGD